MAEVDTSIYNNVFRPQGGGANLLGMGQQAVGIASGLANMQNALNQNRLFQMELGFKQAIGPIMQQSIDPQTGEVDYNKAALMMSANPATAYKAPEFINQMLLRQGTQLDIFTKQLSTAATQQKTFADKAMGLIVQHGTGVTQQQVMGGLGELVAQGQITPNQATAFAAALPKDGPNLLNYLKGQAAAFGTRADSMEQVLGKISTVDLGGSQQIFRTSPLTGETKQLGRFEKTMTPEQLNALTSVVGPRGTTQAPRTEVAPVVGGMGTPMNRLAGAGAPPGGAMPERPITDYPPEVKQYKTDQGKKISDYEDTLNSLVADNSRMIYNLDEAWKAAQKFQPGGGAELFKQFAQAAQAIPGIPKEFVDTLARGSLPNMQIMEKITVPLATQAMRQSFGGVQRFAQMEWQRFQDAFPNIKTDPRAITAMFDHMKRIAHLTELEQTEWNKWKDLNAQDAGKYPLNKFQAHWQKKLVDNGVIDYSPYEKRKPAAGAAPTREPNALEKLGAQ